MQLPAGSAEPPGAARRARLKAAALPGSSGGGTDGRRITPHRRKKLPGHLPVERLGLLSPEVRDERAAEVVRIGEDVSETLEWRPASFVRL